MTRFCEWLARRPERRIVCIGHLDFIHKLLGIRLRNCGVAKYEFSKDGQSPNPGARPFPSPPSPPPLQPQYMRFKGSNLNIQSQPQYPILRFEGSNLNILSLSAGTATCIPCAPSPMRSPCALPTRQRRALFSIAFAPLLVSPLSPLLVSRCPLSSLLVSSIRCGSKAQACASSIAVSIGGPLWCCICGVVAG